MNQYLRRFVSYFRWNFEISSSGLAQFMLPVMIVVYLVVVLCYAVIKHMGVSDDAYKKLTAEITEYPELKDTTVKFYTNDGYISVWEYYEIQDKVPAKPSEERASFEDALKGKNK